MDTNNIDSKAVLEAIRRLEAGILEQAYRLSYVETDDIGHAFLHLSGAGITMGGLQAQSALHILGLVVAHRSEQCGIGIVVILLAGHLQRGRLLFRFDRCPGIYHDDLFHLVCYRHPAVDDGDHRALYRQDFRSGKAASHLHRHGNRQYGGRGE